MGWVSRQGFTRACSIRSSLITSWRNPGTCLGNEDKSFRLQARRADKQAASAIGHKILVSAHHVLSTGKPYAELGGTYLDQLDTTKTAARLVQRLERRGLKVALESTPLPTP